MKAYGGEFVKDGKLNLNDEAFEQVWLPLSKAAIYGGICLDDGYAASRWNPGFIAYLQDCGLNSREVGCCCLMCIGLRGNEIASYLKITDRSYYNFTVNIRKKLGIDRNGDSLGRFLCRKIKSVP